MSDEKILVTGSAGFIGFHLSKRLLEMGHEVVGIDNFNDYYCLALKRRRSEILKGHDGYQEHCVDLCDLDKLAEIFKASRFSSICNLAAQAGVRYSLDHPHVYERSNIAGFLNILEMSRHHGVKRVIYASSSSVYGGNKKIPFSETDPVDLPISLYAATKKANELIAHSYSHLFNIQTIGLRFFTVYGPWGRPDMALWLFVEAIKNGGKIRVFNHGDMKRDFTYIDDIIDGVIPCLFNDNLDPYEIFNLGNNRSEQLMHMIGIIEDELGCEALKEMMPMQPGDVPESYANIDRARAKLNYVPRTSISEGIPNFLRWYNANPELAEEVRQSRRG